MATKSTCEELEQQVQVLETEAVKRMQVEKALREKLQHFRELWDDAPVAYHVLDTEGIKQAAQKAIGHFGGIDVLINNGGISHRSLTHETDIDFDRKILEIDFFSYLIITKEVLPHMIERGKSME